jgi:hypothetical protein
LGELGINTTDGKLFIKKSVSGTESIVEIGSGGGPSGPILQSKIEITSNTQLTSGYNGLSVGPVAVGNGIVVTVPANSTWKVI